MSSDNDQFHLPFSDSGIEHSERGSVTSWKSSVRKAKNQAVEAERSLACLQRPLTVMKVTPITASCP